MSKDKNYKSKSFNMTFRYIDDLLSSNNKPLKQYITSMYPSDLELKETTESDRECSFLDLLLFNENGELKSKGYDKRDDFDFDIVNYPYMSSNIPINPAYGVYVSRLLAFSRNCTNFTDFYDRHKSLFNRLVKQGYSKTKLKKTFLKFKDKYQNILQKYHQDLSEHINKIMSECL